MKKLVHILFFSIGFVFQGYSQNLQWIKPFQPPSNIWVYDCATNYEGELVMFAEVGDSVNIGGLQSTQWVTSPWIDHPSSLFGTLVLKYDTLGQVDFYFWLDPLGSYTIDNIILDDDGNTYLAGTVNGVSVDMDPGPGIDNVSSNWVDFFVAKYDGNGNLIWIYQSTTSSMATSWGADVNDLIVNSLGEVFLLAEFQDQMDLDPSLNTVNINPTVAGTLTQVLVKIDALGQYNSHGVFYADAPGWLKPQRMTFNANESTIYLGGIFNGTVDFDPGAGVQSGASVGSNTDLFFTGINATNLNYLWHRTLNGTGDGNVDAIETDKYNNIYLCGVENGSIDFDPFGPVVNLVTSGTVKYLSKYNSTGNFLWVRENYTNSIKTDEAPRLWMCSNFTGTVDIEPGTSVLEINTTGDNDIVISNHNSNSATVVWHQEITGTTHEYLNCYDVAKSGIFYAIGRTFSSDNDIDPTTGNYNCAVQGSEATFFIVKLAPWMSSLGVDEDEEVLGCVVYPNPAAEQWTIRSDEELKGSFNLIDFSGKVVKSGEVINQKSFNVSASDLPRGIYLMQFVSVTGELMNIKLVKSE